jgi:hypothetical protein
LIGAAGGLPYWSYATFANACFYPVLRRWQTCSY